jgi:hypothetical protein
MGTPNENLSKLIFMELNEAIIFLICKQLKSAKIVRKPLIPTVL